MNIVYLFLILNSIIYLSVFEDNSLCKFSETETNINNYFVFQDYLVASFSASQDFDKNKSQITNFVKALEERPNHEGYIIFTSSRRQLKRQIQIYANKLKIRLEKEYGVSKKRLVVKYGGIRKKAMFDFYVIPPQPKLITD